ncbi:MAG: hypothetical protein J4G17_11330 [Anaerolineae bacterium]|nr:hypothetical protein [Anaerolineae bacterium]
MLQRIGTKLYLADGCDLDPAALIPVMQGWIQRRQLPGLLIDVADYSHAHHGPGIMLIGNEGDLSVDFGEGRAGILYVRKREHASSLPDGLLACVRQCLLAAELLQRDNSLPDLQVDVRETRVILSDRLRAPNTPEAFAALRGELAIFAYRLYGDASLDRANDDPRDNLAVTVSAADEHNLAGLLGRTAAASMA